MPVTSGNGRLAACQDASAQASKNNLKPIRQLINSVQCTFAVPAAKHLTKFILAKTRWKIGLVACLDDLLGSATFGYRFPV